jgi:hypothetical protein
MENVKEIERSELLALLEQWQKGALDERAIHEQVESKIDELGELPSYPEDDPRSIPVEVLLHLDILNHQLITPEDIPAMEAFLRTSLGDEAQGWAVWRNYWNNLDLEKRKRELESNQYYCT